MRETQPAGHILHIYAHPDDESYGNPATIRLYAGRGVSMSLITATRGEAGKTNGACGREELGAVRESELRCACAALGVERLEILGYPDGGLAGVDFDEAVSRLMAFCRETRPDVLVSYGEDGVTGHPDHVAVSRWTAAAFFRLRDYQDPTVIRHQISPLSRSS